MADGAEDRTKPGAPDRLADAPLPKPPELQALGPACSGLFGLLQRWFSVGDQLTVDLSAIDATAVVAELQDPQLVAGFAMRKLQALHLVAQPGFRTTTDVVVTQIDSLLRALVEAPRRHMTRTAEFVNWDHEWAVLDAGMFLPAGCPESEALEFRRLVKCLIDARLAVVDASENQIRVFA